MSDAGRPRPTLVADIGGTLLVTDRPGAYHRVLRELPALGVDVDDPGVQARVARHVLTGADPLTAGARLEADMGLAPTGVVAKVLQETTGRAELLPGARRLLSAAADAGWRVVAASNAAHGVPGLPPALAGLVQTVVRSADVGVIKQDPRFWQHLHEVVEPSPMLTLVVGDSFTADVEPARAAGHLALQVNTTDLTTADVAHLIEEAGPAPGDAVAVVGGPLVRWAERDVVESPHLAPLVERATSVACLLHTRAGCRPCTVVRRRSRGPALVLPDRHGVPPLGWLVPEHDRRPAVPPGDLAAHLDQAGLTLDGLPVHDRRHLVSLVREAKDATTRAARIADVVEHLRASQLGAAAERSRAL